MKFFTLPKSKMSPTLSRVLNIFGLTIIVGVNVAIFISNYNVTHSKSLTVAQQFYEHALHEHKIDECPFPVPVLNWEPAPLCDIGSGMPATAPPAGTAMLSIFLLMIVLTTVSFRFMIGEEIKNDMCVLDLIIPPPRRRD